MSEGCSHARQELLVFLVEGAGGFLRLAAVDDLVDHFVRDRIHLVENIFQLFLRSNVEPAE